MLAAQSSQPGTQPGAGTHAPLSAEEEDVSVVMRIHISQARDLAAKDFNGLSDPYVKVTVGGHKFTTKVIHKTLNPVWNAAFDFDLETQSVPDQIRLAFWDKDRIGKDDFMGVVDLPFDDASLWADTVPKHFDDRDNMATSLPGKSSNVSGEVEIKFGFIDTKLAPIHEGSRADCQRTWATLTSGRNKLGLGQRMFRDSDNRSISMADIPMASGETDASLEPSEVRQDTSSSTATSSNNTLHGVVFMEVTSAANLPRLHNVTRTGFDMDPFVVISFGKYIFRTRVVRHNLNPVWKAKLMFRVHHGEESFKVKYSIHDWDKMSGNDHVGVAFMEINRLIQAAGDRDTAPVETILPPTNGTPQEAPDPDMNDYVLDVELASDIKIATEGTRLDVRAKFVPYTTLRRRFWLGLAKAYDADSYQRGTYSRVLIQTMLEGLGSTLSGKTIDSFFAPFHKDPEHDELTFDELYERLERQVRVNDRTEIIEQPVAKTKKWFRRSQPPPPNPLEAGVKDNVEELEEDQEDSELYMHLTRNQLPREASPEAVDMVEPTEADFDPQTSEGEHLILGDFVTEANAQRKWITKVVKSLGYGRYVVGKSNANIIVQDRATGAMTEEKMPTFIRLGIRLLYKSPANKIRVNKILADMSRKQGLKFNDPRSTRDIEPFIRFHHLESQMKEVLEPIRNFKNFNEFFYRKLKHDARTLSSPGDERVAVSVADCRMTCFQTIEDATKFWIKGAQFTVGRLLNDEVLAKKYDGGSLAIFRLAPQDYHRYHIPVKGVLSEPKPIEGEYYTVNPMAIRSQLDVYGENKRVVSTIESKEFGTVAYVAIGAMMVGSIVLTTESGQEVERMDEHGYFAFGGSTIVVLFEPGTIQFDEDLVRSSKEQIEMLVKVGMRIGTSTKV
ncbi:hypothetical protein BGZ67_010793 [Mortierella alpina]|nr:hypothetical protein BGZ67_010793 [Mortierella alpina]